jgi:hypothetical protein
MATPDANVIADLFAIGPPRTQLEPLVGGSGVAWRLVCDSGAYFVKRVRADEPEWWRLYAERAMAYEQRALAAGIDMPRPIEPKTPVFGYIASIDDEGPIRAYEWMDMRELERDDDLATWLGRTLAELHAIEPSGRRDDKDDAFGKWDTEEYGIRPVEDWRAWFEEARTKQPELAPIGFANLDVISRANAYVEESLRHVDDLVITHKDVEPWNLVITPSGPCLIDWDWIGRDSAWLVTAWSAVAYGAHKDPQEEPDRGRTGAVLRAYLDAGGAVACGPPWSMGRRVGLRLTRLAYHLWTALGHRPVHKIDLEEARDRAIDGLSGLAKLLDDCARWAELVASVT